MRYGAPKGVFDVLPEDPEEAWRASDRWQYVEEQMRGVACDYGYREIRTPLFERTELFVRGVGEGSDIVTKEMYTFLDKGGRSLTLRPEGTASVMRAFVERHLDQIGSLHKFFYIGPMFRYERPQAGRYRQHHQFGVEAIGVARAEQDVEAIDMLCELYRRLGLKHLTVMVNSVGDPSSRAPYREALMTYLAPRLQELSPDSQTRFAKNVLRILDSKDPSDQNILKEAPSLLKMLNAECTEHFERVCALLGSLKIPYVVTPKLVRGLDYYNKTVFEVVSGELGAQNTVGAGGRYDGLLADLGGPDLPAVGFATGMERILQTMDRQGAHFPSPPHPLVFLIAVGEEGVSFCFDLLCRLRRAGVAAEMDLAKRKLPQAMQLAIRWRATFVLVVGDRELQSGRAQLKNMESRDSVEVELSELVEKMQNPQCVHG